MWIMWHCSSKYLVIINIKWSTCLHFISSCNCIMMTCGFSSSPSQKGKHAAEYKVHRGVQKWTIASSWGVNINTLRSSIMAVDRSPSFSFLCSYKPSFMEDLHGFMHLMGVSQPATFLTPDGVTPRTYVPSVVARCNAVHIDATGP